MWDIQSMVYLRMCTCMPIPRPLYLLTYSMNEAYICGEQHAERASRPGPTWRSPFSQPSGYTDHYPPAHRCRSTIPARPLNTPRSIFQAAFMIRCPPYHTTKLVLAVFPTTKHLHKCDGRGCSIMHLTYSMGVWLACLALGSLNWHSLGQAHKDEASPGPPPSWVHAAQGGPHP